MRIQDIIAAKRDGFELSDEDITRIVSEYGNGTVPDYQMSAFLMAAYIRGLSFSEISAMTQAMIDSGEVLDLSAVDGIKADKHSTGGVGDKTTLIIVPVLASCGLKLAKMSGRGLGFTGGTMDKLESIPGFNTSLSQDKIIAQLNSIGAVMAGQMLDIVPADKKIYALRDVTATVDSIPLISASVMSKKIACSSDVILLDVKVGSGAFAREIKDARELAETMIAIGRNLGRRVGAVISDMNQPLGNAVGNAVEVIEAIETLRGGGPADLRTLCIELCAVILQMAGYCNSIEDARKMAADALDSGAALSKFREIVAAQGGDIRIIDDTSLLPQASITFEVRSDKAGFIEKIDCARVGVVASILGAGREKKEDSIDPSVGIIVRKKIGDYVDAGDVIAVLYANDKDRVQTAQSMIKDAYMIGARCSAPTLIHEMII